MCRLAHRAKVRRAATESMARRNPRAGVLHRARGDISDTWGGSTGRADQLAKAWLRPGTPRESSSPLWLWSARRTRSCEPAHRGDRETDPVVVSSAPPSRVLPVADLLPSRRVAADPFGEKVVRSSAEDGFGGSPGTWSEGCGLRDNGCREHRASGDGLRPTV